MEKKPKLKTLKVKCVIKVPFWTYDTKEQNTKAIYDIRSHILAILKGNLDTIPLFVEEESPGVMIQEQSERTTIYLKDRKRSSKR